jgi:uncharacterized protein YcnI
MPSVLKSFLRLIGFMLILIIMFVKAADAQVIVTPSSSTTGTLELYTVKVPTEKSDPTIQIKLAIPSELVFEQYQPVAGWDVSLEKDDSGKIQSLTWIATGQGILPTQFQEFKFLAQNPKSGAKVSWNAYQYYQDGSIVEWTKNEGTDTPHTTTAIVTGHVMSDGSVMADNMMPSEPTHKSGTDPNLLVAIWLSAISVVLSTIALIIVVKQLRNKP